MTQSNILELAKQGNQEAIASVVNYLLKDKGITAKAVRRNDCLVVVLESDRVPEQTSSVASIHKLMMQLNVESIKLVKVYGKGAGHSSTAWTDTLNFTSSLQLEEAKKQTSSSETQRQGKLKAIADRWPAWFPYPSSWLRTFALILWIAIILRIAGFWSLALGGLLVLITAHVELLFSSLVLGLLVSVLVFSYFHHFFFGKSLPGYPRLLPSPRSLWEGFYAPIVMLLAFMAVLIILIPFLIPDCRYETVEQIVYCVELTEGELTQYQYRMAQIGGVIWLMSAVYLYQTDYLIRHRLIPQVKVALQNYQPVKNASGQKPQKLAKKLLIILLIPLVAVGVYLFSKLPALRETVPVPVASQAPSATPAPIAATSPTSSPDRDFFAEAVNKAMSASSTTQSAKSKDEWNLVASQWQDAIALMKAVPPSHPQHTTAQQKAVEYQRNLDYAQNNAAAK